jgi:hypothetical protein
MTKTIITEKGTTTGYRVDNMILTSDIVFKKVQIRTTCVEDGYLCFTRKNCQDLINFLNKFLEQTK